MTIYQYDEVRADIICPNCLQDKSVGLLLCWPCHHSQKQFNDGDYSAKCKAKIAKRNTALIIAKTKTVR